VAMYLEINRRKEWFQKLVHEEEVFKVNVIEATPLVALMDIAFDVGGSDLAAHHKDLHGNIMVGE
jgi:hypothetical protein